MSNGARIAIATVGLFFAAMCSLMALSPKAGLTSWLPTAFCLTLSLACVRGKVGKIALRAIAAAVFLLCLGYVITEAMQGNMGTGERSQASLPNAIMAFIIFGLPFGYLAIFGFYPVWGRFGEHFGGKLPGQATSDTEEQEPNSKS